MEKNSTNMKIWGMSYGVLGDLIMGLPMLNYFEKKYPGSYKFWVIEKKCSISAQLYFNHPLIDKIKITDEWSAFGEIDKKLMQECDIIAECPPADKRGRYDWYNYESCVEHTAKLGGIEDFTEVLTEEERYPELVKWFDIGFSNKKSDTYSKNNQNDLSQFNKNIAIWPFATGGRPGRSPSPKWWHLLINELAKENFTVYHYGRSIEPKLSNSENYKCLTSLSFFDQVKSSLASKVAIGPDTGPMWIMGAYSHPAINLMTNHMLDHKKNLLALAPINKNAVNLFGRYHNGIGCNNIPVKNVIAEINNTTEGV